MSTGVLVASLILIFLCGMNLGAIIMYVIANCWVMNRPLFLTKKRNKRKNQSGNGGDR